MSLLKVSGITKQEGRVRVLQEVSFIHEKFRRLAIVGASGSGKSTLLKVIGGLVQPDAGEVLFNNKRVEGPDEKLIPGHPEIAYMSQHFELRNNYRVEEILEYANRLPVKAADTIYEVCRIRHLLKRKTDQVSGGEKQRIALAKLLITSPALLLLDEPYSNLDPIYKDILKSVITDISEKLKITCLLVSHDSQDILSWADEIIVMRDGLILQQGTPEMIYSQPVNEYTGALFGKYNLLPPETLKMLSRLPGIELNGKTVFIRPENFKIVEESKTAIKGKVHKVHYLGSSCDVEVLLGETVITVKTATCGVKAGDNVYISLSGGVWYI